MHKFIVASLLTLSFVLGVFFSVQYQQKQQQLSPDTLLFPDAKILPEFSVLNQNGSTVNNDILENRWSLMFFGFTNCPDVCPNTLTVLAEMQSLLDNDNNKPQLIFVTVDPMRDTPDILKTYIKSFSDDIVGLTGELHKIQALTDALGVAYAYNALPDGNYTVDHSAAIFIFNPKGEYTGVYTGLLAAKPALATLTRDFKIISSKSSSD